MWFRREKPIPEPEPSKLTWYELRDKLNVLDAMLYPEGRRIVTEILKRIMDRIDGVSGNVQ